MNTIFHMEALPSLLIGVVVAILTGGLLDYSCLVYLSHSGEQIISGTVINILATGVTGFLNRQLFFEKGSIFGGNVPMPGNSSHIAIPGLSQIPIFGKVFEQQPIAWLPSFWYLFQNCFIPYPRGLRTRAVGEHPRAADTVGINVSFMRYMNVIIGGLLAGWVALLYLESGTII
jgi:simple sugar transport system permease protein